MQPRSEAGWFHTISVAMEQWTTQHRAFVFEAYFKNGDSAITTQRLFCRHFNPSAWGHLNPSSYCDVGRLFYGVFKLWSKLQRKK